MIWPRLRCWAEHPNEPGVLCVRAAGHSTLGPNHRGLDTQDDTYALWHDKDCSDGAADTGHRTAALRILELHQRADLLAFQAGLPVNDRLRAVAARLMAGTQAAAADRESLLEDYTMDGDLWTAPRRAELWLAAADLLKPWTGAT